MSRKKKTLDAVNGKLGCLNNVVQTVYRVIVISILPTTTPLSWYPNESSEKSVKCGNFYLVLVPKFIAFQNAITLKARISQPSQDGNKPKTSLHVHQQDCHQGPQSWVGVSSCPSWRAR